MTNFNNKYRAEYLFSDNSFLIGIGSIFNLSGSSYFEYDFSDSPEEADFKAIASDWFAVGDDIANSIIDYQHQN